MIAAPAPTEVVAGEGELPVDFPAATPLGQVGEAVLAAPEAWVARALSVGAEEQVISLFAARVVARGPGRSRVESHTGASWTLPNALIVPLGAAQRAEPGQVVLTHAPPEGRWVRAVVAGGTEAGPRALLLDVPFAAPDDARAVTLRAGEYRALSAAWQPGTSVACRQGTELKRAVRGEAGDARGAQEASGAPSGGANASTWVHYRLIRAEGEALLGLSYAGELTRLQRGHCQGISPDGAVKVDEPLLAPELGSYVPVRVVEPDGAAQGAPGRALVRRASVQRQGAQREGAQAEFWVPRLDLLREP